MSMKSSLMRKPEMTERDAIEESLSESIGPISDEELAQAVIAYSDKAERLRRISGY